MFFGNGIQKQRGPPLNGLRCDYLQLLSDSCNAAGTGCLGGRPGYRVLHARVKGLGKDVVGAELLVGNQARDGFGRCLSALRWLARTD